METVFIRFNLNTFGALVAWVAEINEASLINDIV